MSDDLSRLATEVHMVVLQLSSINDTLKDLRDHVKEFRMDYRSVPK